MVAQFTLPRHPGISVDFPAFWCCPFIVGAMWRAGRTKSHKPLFCIYSSCWYFWRVSSSQMTPLTEPANATEHIIANFVSCVGKQQLLGAEEASDRLDEGREDDVPQEGADDVEHRMLERRRLEVAQQQREHKDGRIGRDAARNKSVEEHRTQDLHEKAPRLEEKDSPRVVVAVRTLRKQKFDRLAECSQKCVTPLSHRPEPLLLAP
jgi:hypothetical protein